MRNSLHFPVFSGASTSRFRIGGRYRNVAWYYVQWGNGGRVLGVKAPGAQRPSTAPYAHVAKQANVVAAGTRAVRPASEGETPIRIQVRILAWANIGMGCGMSDARWGVRNGIWLQQPA